MKFPITHCFVFFASLAILSTLTGCRVKSGGAFYSPSAWQFYNPLKSEAPDGLDETAFDELDGVPVKTPPESIAKLDSPSVSTPTGGYGNSQRGRVVAGMSSSTINLDPNDKTTVGTQEGLYASKTPVNRNSTVQTAPPNQMTPVTSQTPNVIARTATPEQPRNQTPSFYQQENAAMLQQNTQTVPPVYGSAAPSYQQQVPGYGATSVASNSTNAPMNQPPYSPQQQQQAAYNYSNTNYSNANSVSPGFATTAQVSPQLQQLPSSSPAPTYYNPGNNPPYTGQQVNAPAYTLPQQSAPSQMATPGTYSPAGNYPQTGATMVPAVDVPANSVPVNSVPANNYSTVNGYPASPAEIAPLSTPTYNGGFNSFGPSTTDSYRPGTVL